MKLILTPIHKKLNKAFLKQDLNRGQIEAFKANLKILFSKSEIAEKKKEHEEHFKNIVSDFLKDTYYKNYYEININKRKDLVIHNGKSSSESVGVIIEAKKPSNESEMISQKTPNTKALHELLHYYMQERFINGNKELKHVIATNSYDWYIFDAADFEKFFYENKKIRKNYEDWNNGVLVGSNTDWFYNEVAKPYIDKELAELNAVHFNLLDYKEIIENTEMEDDDGLVNLYKILSPEHLLKKPFANDSNTLNKAFYNELLHIIGLEEKPDGGKKLIDRKDKNRDDGSLLENTINILKTQDKLKSIDNREQFGESEDDQIYSIGLELCITWLNRVLFLKLLEGQLIKYHNGNSNYAFINAKIIGDFDELDELFFEVLAVKANERTKSVSDKYGNIPYLNSSLFEISELESKTIQISALKHRLELSIYPHSVLKNKEKNKQLEAKNTLHYLFEFLDAYNFSSDSSAKIQENNKTIINASVLGLIFEKINGYKDGSFFTPGFITMYMCRETIRRAVAQKFKELENPEIDTFEDVKLYCAKFFKMDDLTRFNKHIDSLKICDPAVGSGHFLVSALNEMIAIKSELNILTDRDGTPLEYEITVDNDELTILNKKTNKPFEYLLGADQKPPKNLQQVQVTLFGEKQKIIENCLFGVDINPKSVLICRLRLWIELLKNAYYKAEGFTELETLPNIDINIKCGNSLISRYKLNDDVFETIPNFIDKLKQYRFWVEEYKKTDNKKVKQQITKDIKSFTSIFRYRDPRVVMLDKQISKKTEDYLKKFKTNQLFEHEDKEGLKKQKVKIENELKKLTDELTELKRNRLFDNAFEWRYEFPEVLDENGDFVGFDVVIGNPPWGAELSGNLLSFIKNDNKEIVIRMIDTFMFFINLNLKIKNKNGLITQIVPDVLLYQMDNEKLRAKILLEYQLHLAINLGDNIFEDVSRASCIVMIGSQIDNLTEVFEYHKNDEITINKIAKEKINTDFLRTLPNKIFATRNLSRYSILRRFNEEKLISLIDKDGIQRGISPDLKEAFIVDDSIIDFHNLETEFIFSTITGGRDIERYYAKDIGKSIIYTKKGDDESSIKNIIDYISKFKESITCKEVKQDKHPFWALHRARNPEIFNKNEKVLGVITGDKIFVSLDESLLYPTDGLYVFSSNNIYSNHFIVGLLNSKFITFLYRLISLEENRALAQIKPSILGEIPVSKNFNKQLVEKIEYFTISIINKLKRDDLDYSNDAREIDQLVYRLYGLSPEEIAIVEGA